MKTSLIALLALSVTTPAAFADGTHAQDQDGASASAASPALVAEFDILAAHAHREGTKITCHM
ncbi:MAG: hypothetical protein WA784_09805, partial [Albidovulum sp.]